MTSHVNYDLAFSSVYFSVQKNIETRFIYCSILPECLLSHTLFYIIQHFMVAEVESIRLLLNYYRLQTFTIDRYRDPTN